MDYRQLKKQRIRRKFKQIVRQVINNIYWLSEESEMQIGDNIKSNVSFIYRRKKDLKRISVEVKSILRKKLEWRTDADKDKIYHTIEGLKCFREWAENVKYKLVSCTYFVCYGPNRTIVEQDRIPEALYFMLSGEAEFLKTTFDEVIQKWVTNSVGTIGQGSMFGEVSLLRNLPRLASVKTLTHCELLMVDKNDFESILSHTIMHQWNEIRASLACFPYFKGISENSIIQCCRISKIREFEPEEILFSKKTSSAHFILNGSCKLFEKMYIREKRAGPQTQYSLFRPDQDLRSTVPSHPPISAVISSDSRKAYFDSQRQNVMKEMYEKCPMMRDHFRKLEIQRKINEEEEDSVSESSQYINLPSDVKCHFIQVCTFTKLACLFENNIFDNRYLVSETRMKILTIPIYWLKMENRAKVWNRVLHFMHHNIPNHEQVFKKFVENRKWIKYKNKLTKQILGEKNKLVKTAWRDVPYSLRFAAVSKDI